MPRLRPRPRLLALPRATPRSAREFVTLSGVSRQWFFLPRAGRDAESKDLTYPSSMITLVLLPGMDGTGIFFEDFAAAIQPEFKPVIVRYPNDPSLGYAGLEPIARSALPQDEPFLILGESFSGPLAISIAASNPAGLLGLILCVTFARNPHPLLPLVCAILKPLPAWRVPRFIQQPNLFGRFDSPYLRAKLRGVRGRVSAENAEGQAGSCRLHRRLREAPPGNSSHSLSSREARSRRLARVRRLHQENPSKRRSCRTRCATFAASDRAIRCDKNCHCFFAPLNSNFESAVMLLSR